MSVIETYTSNKLDILDKHPSALHLDLRSNKSIDDFLRKLNKICSNIDIAIFLSGVLPGKKLDKFESSDVYEVMAVNFNVHGKLISKILSLFNERWRLLLFSCISVQRGSFDPIYAVSKSVVLSLIKSLATALPSGTRINAIELSLI